MWVLLIPHDVTGDSTSVPDTHFLSHVSGPAVALGQQKPGWFDELTLLVPGKTVRRRYRGAVGRAGWKPLDGCVGGGSSKNRGKRGGERVEGGANGLAWPRGRPGLTQRALWCALHKRLPPVLPEIWGTDRDVAWSVVKGRVHTLLSEFHSRILPLNTFFFFFPFYCKFYQKKNSSQNRMSKGRETRANFAKATSE